MTLLPFILARRAPRQPAPPPRRRAARGSTLGLTEDPAEFLARHADIVEALRARKSLRCIQKATGKARNTILKVKRMTQEPLP